MKPADLDFARLALTKGWISRDVHDASLAEADRCQALGLEKSADEILLERGKLSAEQVRALREALGWSLLRPRIGDYEVIRRVGVGGMGAVFEARHVRLKQHIALKVLFPRLARDPRFADLFLREARALGRLSHPHLVHAIHAGRDGEYCYLAMEYIEGENLLQLLARGGPVAPRRAAGLIRAALEALCALEEKGLIHRDVKPANILIGPDGVVKLADLGLLKAVDGPAGPRETVVCGTPHYVSPEQALRREDLDSRSDLYSLAATWYHILIGRPPFVGVSAAEILAAHIEKQPPPPSRLRKGIPPPVERVLLKWLAKDPAARAPDLRAALAEIRELEALLGKGNPFRRWGQALARGAARRGVRRAGLAVLVAALGVFLLTFLRPGPASQVDVASPRPGLTEAPEAGIARPSPGIPSRAAAVPVETVEATKAAPPAAAPVEEPAVQRQAGPDRERPLWRPLARSARLGFESAGAFVRRTLEPAGAGLAARRAQFTALQPLGLGFHASFVALAPGEAPSGVVLRYSFAASSQLGDFRALPGSWAVDRGLRSLAGPLGEPLDSVAWFARPLRIEWDLEAETSLIVGFGALRIAPGRGRDGRVWTAGAEEVPILAAPPAPAGRGAVVIREGAVEFFPELPFTAEPLRVRTETPAAGRFSVILPEGRSLRWLSLAGHLEPTWAAARLQALAGSTAGPGSR